MIIFVIQNQTFALELSRLPGQRTPPPVQEEGREGVLCPLGAPAWLAAASIGVSGVQVAPVFSGCIVYIAFLYNSQRRGIIS